ncbi:gluconokinase [Streptomyces olivochromogenes]|uniref:Gluconokinase n=1 Tax=Streptomyces olivochromogenes TaxID=1963 RepID=A0A250VCR5_STROL|nr:gluconokinase [Streptomyces olivochromogenes]KUN44686.1 gluconate kinase [Streptomyces olivochromogenes]GAX51987.1 gluconokinase [Streptomyces olivochromogenes]
MTGAGGSAGGGEGDGQRPPIIVVLGVSGSGKTTFGQAAAEDLGLTFVEGDDFHPAANIAKMTAGHALDDTDRAPWLRALSERIRRSAEAREGLVVACSALKRAYRDEFREAGGPALRYLYLALDRATARDRVSRRTGHFMPARLVDSQFETLEPLERDEPGMTLDATAGLPVNLARVRTAVEHCAGPPGP